MPTPSDSATSLHFSTDPHIERSNHTSCPPESERSWREQDVPGPESITSRQYSDNAPRIHALLSGDRHSAQENVIPEITTTPTALEEKDLTVDRPSSEAMSPMHLGSVSPRAGNTESKDEEQESEHQFSPELEREPASYVDGATSTDDTKFSNARVCESFCPPSRNLANR